MRGYFKIVVEFHLVLALLKEQLVILTVLYERRADPWKTKNTGNATANVVKPVCSVLVKAFGTNNQT